MMGDEELSSLLASYAGKLFLLTICQQCGYFINTHQQDSLDTAYHNGRRSVAVELVERIKSLNFGAYLEILALEQEIASER